MYMNFEKLVNFLEDNLKKDEFEEAVKIIAKMENPNKDVDEAEEFFNSIGESISNNAFGFLSYEYFRMDDTEWNKYKDDNGLID